MARPKTLHPYTESKFKLAIPPHPFEIKEGDDFKCARCGFGRAMHPEPEPKTLDESEPVLHRPTTHEK